MMKLILISGFSGSGKSVALRFLEDIGYLCVDNSPLPLLKNLVAFYQEQNLENLAVSVDIRSGAAFDDFAKLLQTLNQKNVQTNLLFLESIESVLIRRFSETRRRHPLGNLFTTLEEAITKERELLSPIRELGHRIDTSYLSAKKLQQFIKQWLAIPDTPINLVFESFGFKYNLPIDADFVFDVRCLPNPYYEPNLRMQTGLDLDVRNFFQDKIIVSQMIDDIESFLQKWVPRFQEENRHYLTVAIGCTGGQHRSVFICQNLSERFAALHAQVRHRQIEGK